MSAPRLGARPDAPAIDDVTDTSRASGRDPSPRATGKPSGAIGRVSFDLDRLQTLPDMPVAELIAMLEPRARAGDAEAARLMYLGLYRCKPWPVITHSETAYIDPVVLQRTGMDEAGFRRWRAAADALEAQRQAEDCKGVAPDQVAQAGYWLRTAAEAGDAYAKLAYADAADEVLGNATRMLADPEAVARFRSDAVRYLVEVADLGMPEAMARLSGIYGSGILAEKDLVRAYAYGEAAEQMSASPVPDPDLEEYRQALSGDQLRAARTMARSLVHGGR